MKMYKIQNNRKNYNNLCTLAKLINTLDMEEEDKSIEIDLTNGYKQQEVREIYSKETKFSPEILDKFDELHAKIDELRKLTDDLKGYDEVVAAKFAAEFFHHFVKDEETEVVTCFSSFTKGSTKGAIHAHLEHTGIGKEVKGLLETLIKENKLLKAKLKIIQCFETAKKGLYISKES